MYILIFFKVNDVSSVMLSMRNKVYPCVSGHPSLPLSAATFGTASMSMPTGFGTPTPYSLPTSFSGSFQQPAFPAQAAFPQQTAFPQQPNGKVPHYLYVRSRSLSYAIMLCVWTKGLI